MFKRENLVVVLLFLFGSAVSYDWDEPTALDEYVHRDDGMFSWSLLNSYRFDNDSCTVYILNVTSQKWMDESFSSQPIWWHFMGVAIPDNIRRDVSYMFIDGGSNDPNGSPPGPDDERVTLVRTVAGLTGYFTAFLLQVPNQGIVFANDPEQRRRTEDAIIAWTWKTYADGNRAIPPEVILRLPMTKAAKAGLDAIREFVLTVEPTHDVNQFIVGGGSKRGWTTWSIAATDRRVIGCTPMVMSLMNFNDTLQAHYRNLGGWTFVFNDYYELNLTARFHEDIITNWDYGLWTYEDMFRYKERLEGIPKLLISAAGDEFFLLTDSHTWWDQMGGQKWLSMTPNAEHTLVPWYKKIGETVASWCLLLLESDTPSVPNLTWLRGPTTNGGRILLSVDSEPDEITAWVSHTWKNDTRKDFRLAVGYPPFIHPVLWHMENVTRLGPGTYDFELENDEIGFGGVFIDCLWTRLIPGMRLHLTTEVQITPDYYPFPPCYGEACYGKLT